MSDKLLIYKIYHGKLKTAKYVQIDPFRKGPLQKLGRRGGGGRILKLQEFSWPQFGGQFF